MENNEKGRNKNDIWMENNNYDLYENLNINKIQNNNIYNYINPIKRIRLIKRDYNTYNNNILINENYNPKYKREFNEIVNDNNNKNSYKKDSKDINQNNNKSYINKSLNIN